MCGNKSLSSVISMDSKDSIHFVIYKVGNIEVRVVKPNSDHFYPDQLWESRGETDACHFFAPGKVSISTLTF